MSYQSADVWAHPEIFKLDENRRPRYVAGVPPDYFSRTGQLWGNPVYDWDKLRETGFDWWLKRVEHNLGLFDLLRIDHFRGLVAYWEVPASEKTAIHGTWVGVPGQEYFDRLRRDYPELPLIAEDLGTITPDVREFIAQLEIPGMKVLLFAFGESLPENLYAPHNHVKNCVIYTGTHDNNTARGWFEEEATVADKRSLTRYLGREIGADDFSWELLRMALMSVGEHRHLADAGYPGIGGRSAHEHPLDLQRQLGVAPAARDDYLRTDPKTSRRDRNLRPAAQSPEPLTYQNYPQRQRPLLAERPFRLGYRVYPSERRAILERPVRRLSIL